MQSTGKLTDFQEIKISRVFDLLYDRNHDGVIEIGDFDIAIDKTCDLLGWPKDGEKRRKGRETLHLIWDGLRAYADKNDDNKITREEWRKMWEDCLNNFSSGQGFPTWQNDYIEFMFDVNDKSGDDVIDLKEYTTFLSSLNLTDKQCEESFKRISNGTNINRKDFTQLWTEYFTSNDRDAKGNWLFGPNFLN